MSALTHKRPDFIRAVRMVRDLVEDDGIHWRTACDHVAYHDRTVTLGLIEILELFEGARKRYERGTA